MNMEVTLVLIFLASLLRGAKNEFTTIEVMNDAFASSKFPHFWKSTGFCPPDPKSEVNKYLTSRDVLLNLALIGALPNQGIKYVRVHWLLNAITMKSRDPIHLDFSYLDQFLDHLKQQGLKPGFELMGLPLGMASDNKDIFDFWYELIRSVIGHYVDRYGSSAVQKWRFESWNEPDLKSYNILNFTLQDYLKYVEACSAALQNVSHATVYAQSYERLEFWGPAGLFRKNHRFCWGILQECNLRPENCPFQYISFHRKGNGSAENVIKEDAELIEQLHAKYDRLKNIPFSNDESDVMVNWSKEEIWRSDCRYASMVVKIISDHYLEIIMRKNVKLKSLSFDNGFLNYHPHYFTQRTLTARFQMNNTIDKHSQFFKKPIYSAMGLMSLLGERYIQSSINPGNKQLSVLATRSEKYGTISLIISYQDNSKINGTLPVRLIFKNLRNLTYVAYMLDNHETNPYEVWHKGGEPVYPAENLRGLIRKAEGPVRIENAKNVEVNTLVYNSDLKMPTILFFNFCSKTNVKPGKVTRLSSFNVTYNEVLIIWKDRKVKSRCIKTYEVEFQPDCVERGQGSSFERINTNDVIFLSYHYVGTGSFGRCGSESTRGRYRIRAVDYWNEPGPYSKVIHYT